MHEFLQIFWLTSLYSTFNWPWPWANGVKPTLGSDSAPPNISLLCSQVSVTPLFICWAMLFWKYKKNYEYEILTLNFSRFFRKNFATWWVTILFTVIPGRQYRSNSYKKVKNLFSRLFKGLCLLFYSNPNTWLSWLYNVIWRTFKVTS